VKLEFQLVRNQFLISTIGFEWQPMVTITSENTIFDIKNSIFDIKNVIVKLISTIEFLI